MTTKNTKRTQPRKRPVPTWRSKRVIAGAIIAAGALIGGLGAWGWHSGAIHKAGDAVYSALIEQTAKRGLVVGEVLVSGRKETDRAALLNAVGLVRGTPILDFSVADTRARVEALPWVRSASVRRALPDTVIVDVVERRPLALWQEKGAFKLIDHDGAVIADPNVGRFGDLLVVVGNGAPDQAAELIEVLDSQPELKSRVKAAVWVGERRWNVRFDNGIDVRMPEGDTASAWLRLADYERSHRVLGRDVRILDLRLPDRMIMRKPTGSTKAAKTAERET